MASEAAAPGEASGQESTGAREAAGDEQQASTEDAEAVTVQKEGTS